MEDLIGKAQQGDIAAMEAILHQYKPLLLSFAKKRYVDNNFEDTYQEAVIAAIKAITDYNSNYGVYFGVFLKKRIWQHLYHLLQRQTKSDLSFILLDPEKVEHPHLTFLMDLETPIWLEQLDQILSERERTTLYLSIQGFSTQEIANQLHVSMNTIKTYRKRIQKKGRSLSSI